MGYYVLIQKQFVLCSYVWMLIKTEELKEKVDWSVKFYPSHEILVQVCLVSARLSCNTNLQGQWKPVTDCANVTCFVLCYTCEVKAADLTLIVKVTLYWPLRLLAFYTLHQSVDISFRTTCCTGKIISNDHVGLLTLWSKELNHNRFIFSLPDVNAYWQVFWCYKENIVNPIDL